MAADKRWWILLHVVVIVVVRRVDAQTDDDALSGGCNAQQPPNTTEFRNTLNDTFLTLRTNLSSGSRFTTAQSQQSTYTLCALFQCRNYLPQPDCLACYDKAVSHVRQKCPGDDSGAWVYFNECFLRYESYDFFQKTNFNDALCAATTSTPEFTAEVQKSLSDLRMATPMTSGRFTAIRRPGGGGSTIFAVAQCSETVTQPGCQRCLTAGYEEMQRNCVQQSATEGRLVDVACFMRYSDTPFFHDNQTTDITRYLRDSRNSDAIIGGIAGGSGFSIILVSAILWYKFSRQMKAVTIGNLLGATKLQSPNRFSFHDLKKETGNFNEENKLGQGSFGTVYKAILKNGTMVAVKKLDVNYSRAKADFETEVRIISNANHRNLVRLLGSCSKRSEMLLVYEYMENGSLDRFLYGDRRGALSWKQRCDIISGTAKGIAYLHENYHVTVMHRDIKPSNILLDDEFQAKIADFGLARLLTGGEGTHVSTNFAGTLGYTAPEYATYGHLSERVDIYSFGIVILEIISGRKCTDLNMNSTDSHSGNSYLLQQARNLYESDMHHNLAEESLNVSDGYSPEELKKLVEIALACTQSTPSSRPSMSEILAMFLSDQPIMLKSTISESESHTSNATISISYSTGR